MTGHCCYPAAVWQAPGSVLCGHHVGVGVVRSAKTSSDPWCLNWQIRLLWEGAIEDERPSFMWGGEKALLENFLQESSPLQSLV